jgi:hypothetical protein
MRLRRIEPSRVLSWRSEDGNWVWTFVLNEHDGATRLISRNRFRLPTLAAHVGMLPMEPGSLVMERKMLRGIKECAERLASVGENPTTHKPSSTATIDFLMRDRKAIIDAAETALNQTHSHHYDDAGTFVARQRLEALLDSLLESLAKQDLGPILAHAHQIAQERFSSGYDLSEVQAAFNALEAATWARVFATLRQTSSRRRSS